MSHAVPLKKRRSYHYEVQAFNKHGTVVFSESGTRADPILIQIRILEIVKLNATHKWAQMQTQVNTIYEDTRPSLMQLPAKDH